MRKEVKEHEITSEFRRDKLGGKAVRHGSKALRNELGTALAPLARAPDSGIKVNVKTAESTS